MSSTRLFLASILSAAYTVSFFLPAMELTYDVKETVMGWQAFMFVPKCTPMFIESPEFLWMFLRGETLANYGVLNERLMILSWMPNPLFWLGLVLLSCGRWRWTMVVSVPALVFAIGPAMYFSQLGLFPRFYVGYFLWVGSFAGLLVTSPLSLRRWHRSWASGTGPS